MKNTGRPISRFRKKQFLLRLIAVTLLFVCVPMIAGSIMAYSNTKKTLLAQQQQSDSQYLKQTLVAVDVVLKQILSSCADFTVDDVCRDFATIPKASYYEAISGDISEKDLPFLYRYLDLKGQIFDRAVTLVNSNEVIRSVYYYSAASGTLLNSDTYQSSPDSFHDTLWMDSIEPDLISPSFLEPRLVLDKLSGRYQMILSMIYRSYQDNFFIVNLDAELLYQSFLAPFDRNDEFFMFVTSASGELLLGSDRAVGLLDDSLREWLVRESHPEGNRIYQSQVDGVEYAVSRLMDEDTGWRFVSMQPTSVLYAPVTALSRFILQMATTVCLIGIAIAVAVSMKLYRPISALLRFIGDEKKRDCGQAENSCGALASNEFGTIYQAISSAYRDHAAIQARLEENMQQFRENFAFSLLKGKLSDPAEIDERLEYFNLSLRLENIYVMILSLHRPCETSAAQLFGPDFLLCYDLIRERFCGRFSGIIEKMDENQMVALLNCEPDQLQGIFSFAEQLIQFFYEQMGIRCHIGLSLIAREHIELPRSYQQAKEAVRFSAALGDKGLTYYNDCMVRDSSYPDLPLARINALKSLILQGKTDESAALLSSILQDAENPSNLYGAVFQQQLYTRILDELLSVISLYGIDMMELFDHSNPFSLLRFHTENGSTPQWLGRVIDCLCRHMSEAVSARQNNYVNEAIRLIELDCGYNMSLNLLSEKLGTSPSYISRIIKEKTGHNFMELLTIKRIERSKVLLSTTEMKIKDISLEVGYCNTYYFIKLFKQHTGLTPGEYRNMPLAI